MCTLWVPYATVAFPVTMWQCWFKHYEPEPSHERKGDDTHAPPYPEVLSIFFTFKMVYACQQGLGQSSHSISTCCYQWCHTHFLAVDLRPCKERGSIRVASLAKHDHVWTMISVIFGHGHPLEAPTSLFMFSNGAPGDVIWQQSATGLDVSFGQRDFSAGIVHCNIFYFLDGWIYIVGVTCWNFFCVFIY